MQLCNTRARWGAIAQCFHWLIVALIIAQLILAASADAMLPGPAKLAILSCHSSAGIAILMLAVVRLLWRLVNPTPALPSTLKPYERWLARFTHATLYSLLFLLPFSGWIMSSANGVAVNWFGHYPLPKLVPMNHVLNEAMQETHEASALGLIVIASLHLVAALKHHFMLKNTVLRRMLPFTGISGTRR
jgi:cytochrome b561